MHLYRYDLINKMYRLRREPCEHDVMRRVHIYCVIEVTETVFPKCCFPWNFADNFYYNGKYMFASDIMHLAFRVLIFQINFWFESI